MTRIAIPLDADIIPPDLPVGADAKLAQHQYFLDQLAEAMQSPRGIRLRFLTSEEAQGQRLKFYRARRYVSRQGIKSFDRLTLVIDGSDLLIKKDLPPNIEWL